MGLIDLDQERFINDESDLELVEIDPNAAIKTNFFIVEQNRTTILKWLLKLRDYVRYLRSLIDIDSIIREVLSQIQSNKTEIFIDKTNAITNQQLIESNGIQYYVKRISVTEIEIKHTTDLNWDVSKLICQVKNQNNDIIYPVINLSNNRIYLQFLDGLEINYYLIFM